MRFLTSEVPLYRSAQPGSRSLSPLPIPIRPRWTRSACVSAADFSTHRYRCATVREGIFLDRKLIPAFELSKRPINAYLLDYSRNPHYKSMLKYNKVSPLMLW